MRQAGLALQTLPPPGWQQTAGAPHAAGSRAAARDGIAWRQRRTVSRASGFLLQDRLLPREERSSTREAAVCPTSACCQQQRRNGVDFGTSWERRRVPTVPCPS